MPKFFVPGVDTERVEEAYAELAREAGKPVPPINERIESITFTHDREEWTATVGHQLQGVKTDRRRRGGHMVDVTTRLSDTATVLAIFAGEPYMVWTNARPITAIPSAWVNPFMAGRPHTVSLFEAAGK